MDFLSALAMDVAITPNLVSNGILSFVAINFFLLLSIWTKLAGLLATAFVVVLCQGWNGIEAHARGHCNSILEPGTQDSALISQELVWPALSPSGPQPPFSTWPFTLVTFVFLLCASTRSPLRKIDIALLSYPEMHRRLFRGGTSVDDEGNMFAT
ncbi:hypothetical protein TCAL_13361 [Tigriopus californicus]|uniref:Uncharacterized protein n=1 Tax=Tigriopus californicus TaxID=6832 RepID=A0A553PQC4_TIGCA|nr:hypothetical protein TCAL_13361 [Tigriopus californicus]|eukprot:TCALIF_13361-PA protein Name:"Protein of unknown function" AED:0.14 eAED:0.14 QI:0/1/0.5/1/1/1/2/4/154